MPQRQLIPSSDRFCLRVGIRNNYFTLRRGDYFTGDTDLSQGDYASKVLDRFGGQGGKTPASPMLTAPNPAAEGSDTCKD